MTRVTLAFLIVVACVGFGPAASPALAQAYVPSVKIGTAALISPSSADIYYGNATTSTNGTGATVRPPEIVELARALKNDPDLIHEYVRNNIEVVWLYGLLAYRTLGLNSIYGYTLPDELFELETIRNFRQLIDQALPAETPHEKTGR